MPSRPSSKMLRMALAESDVAADPAEAIQTAYEWRAGGGSPLSALSSNGGAVSSEEERSSALQEVDECVSFVMTNQEAIDAGEFPEYAADTADAQAEGTTTSNYQIKLLQNLKDFIQAAPVAKEASGKKAAAGWTPNGTHSTKEHALDDLRMFLENTHELHSQRISIVNNLVKKDVKGIYDPQLAWRLWLYWVEAGAMRYAHENGGVWYQLFPKELRKELAKELAGDEEPEIHEMAEKKKQASDFAPAPVPVNPSPLPQTKGDAPSDPTTMVPAGAAQTTNPPVTTIASAKEADWAMDTLNAVRSLGQTYKVQLKQVLESKGPAALQQVLIQKIPGVANAAPKLIPIFSQWLSGQANDNTFVSMLEGVFQKRASWSSEEALHITAGFLRMAGFVPSEINSKTGNAVEVMGLNVNPHVLKHTAKLASVYGLKVKLVTAAPAPPSAAGNHAGPANPNDPTGAPAPGTPAPGAPAAAPKPTVESYGAPTAPAAPEPSMAPPAPAAPAPSAPSALPAAGQAPMAGGLGAPPAAAQAPAEVPPSSAPGVPVAASAEPNADYNGMGTQPDVYPEPKMDPPPEICRNVSVPPVLTPEEASQVSATNKTASGTFLQGYLRCALWSSTGDGDEFLDKSYGMDSFSPEAMRAAERECSAFQTQAGPMLDDMDDVRAGHDFWLNRNGHGSGFWDEDRCPEQFREPLSDLSHKFGETDLYVGDDGLLHFSNQHKFASKRAADGSLIGHIAEIESMLGAIQDIADKVVATGRLTGIDSLASSTERLNVKIYEALLAARTAKGEAQGAPGRAVEDKDDEPSGQPGVALVKVTASYGDDDGDEHEDDVTPSCPACGGEGTYMGALGDKKHFRCRACGMTYSHSKTAKVANKYIVNKPGKNSEGEEAPWCITQKGTGKILSRHTSEAMAEEAFGAMEQSKHGSYVIKAGDYYFKAGKLTKEQKSAGRFRTAAQARTCIDVLKLDTARVVKLKKAEEVIKGPSGLDGDNVDAAIEFINANAKNMEDYSVQHMIEALTSSGFSQQIANAAVSDLLGDDALLALGEPVKGFLG